MTTRLYDIGHDILTAIEAAISGADINGVPLELPSVRYVNNGDIARDQGCSSLVIAVPEMFIGTPGAASAQPVDTRNSRRSVSYVVELTRCVPTPDDPHDSVRPEETDASARDLLAYGDVMFDAIRQGILDGSLLTRCTRITMGSMRNIGPEGGLGGWNLPLGVQL